MCLLCLQNIDVFFQWPSNSNGKKKWNTSCERNRNNLKVRNECQHIHFLLRKVTWLKCKEEVCVLSKFLLNMAYWNSIIVQYYCYHLFTTIILISDYSIPEDVSLEMYHHSQLGKGHQEEEPDRPDFGMSPAEFRSLWQGMVSSGLSNVTLMWYLIWIDWSHLEKSMH